MSEQALSSFGTDRARKRLRRRRAADRRFKWYGRAAIGFALAALALLLASIFSQALSAATYHVVSFRIDAGRVVAAENTSGALKEVYDQVRADLFEAFPDASGTPAGRQEVSALVTRLAALPIAERLRASPARRGMEQVSLPLSDDVDLYLKGAAARQVTINFGPVAAEPTEDGQGVRLSGAGAFARLIAAASLEHANVTDVSFLVTGGRSTVRLTRLSADEAEGSLIAGTASEFGNRALCARIILAPQSERTVSDRQIAWALALKADGRVRRVPHWSLLTHTDSTQPELAGALAAIVGSFLTLLVTASLAIPVGILASIYLEEFAPKNRLTSLIEVNINNLAAVPSIVFGLLGAAVFLGVMGLPRSAPIVGGLVLALLILPVVIIASRAALKAVPDSIRQGALAVGASRMQTVFHHVLPLAAPGMLTGAILGMARALGETAPLLLIGMVAFVADVPRGPGDEASALPVLIYSWATQAERAWEPMTGAVILILLAFLIAMNVAVVYLRHKFERRW
ncbi:MAG: phosphate ABC transporter permease PstA [Hyphomonas sp.]|nr:phosphate ABC transporter permease PstA [Hyphomonas sp.]MCB9971675.1 phosphate ABC transporter permease PstA [Hyphomonas sp.]